MGADRGMRQRLLLGGRDDMSSHQVEGRGNIDYQVLCSHAASNVLCGSAVVLSGLSLCASINERASQVQLMNNIHRGGKHDLIYLGEDNVGETLTEVDTILKEAESKPEFGPIMNDRPIKYGS